MICDKKTKPKEFTKAQIAECSECLHASGKKIWCCKFGCKISENDEPVIIGSQSGIIASDKRIIVPGKNRQRERNGKGCCGEKMEKLIIEAEKEIGADSTVGKLADIAIGNLTHLIEEIFKVSVLKCPATDSRIEKCLICEENTWLTKFEFVRFILKHGREFLKNIEDLTKLPPLPKREKRKRTILFCRLCKCFIPAKARLEDQGCTLGNW